MFIKIVSCEMLRYSKPTLFQGKDDSDNDFYFSYMLGCMKIVINNVTLVKDYPVELEDKNQCSLKDFFDMAAIYGINFELTDATFMETNAYLQTM